MKRLLFIFSLSFSLFSVAFSSWALEKNGNICLQPKNKICRKILKLQPELNPDLALSYSQSIYRYAKKFKISSDLMVAIINQESGFNKKSIRKEKGIIEVNGQFKEVEAGFDFCLMQISYWNIRKRSINTNKLMKESDFCIKTGATILSEFKEMYGKTEKDWWTRYNASTLNYRKEYQRKVERHLVKIQDGPSTIDHLALVP